MLLAARPDLWGLVTPHEDLVGYLRAVGWAWLAVGVGGLVFRTLHLFVLRDVTTGLVWAAKIVTDPFNDVRLYHRAPLALLRGEWIDPMHDVAAAAAKSGGGRRG
jgi:hypothetical protein